MKNKLLLLLLLLVSLTMNSQISIVDFEEDSPGVSDTNPTPEWTGDPNAPVVTEVANPSIGGLNTSANCVQYVETSGSHPANSLQLAFDGTTAKTGYNLTGSNKFVKFLVYSVNQTTFTILLELGTGGTPNFSMEKQVTVALNTWTEVVFDFNGSTGSPSDSSAVINNDGGWNSNIRIHFNNGSAGVGDTYYVDEYVIGTTQPNFTSVADGDWNTPANWNTAYAPDQKTGNVTIASDITITDNISVDNLTINSNQSLTITGNLTNTATTVNSGGSLLVSGTSTGDVTYNVGINDMNWHLLSSPVAESYDGTWIANNDIDDTSGTGTNIAIGTYTNTLDANGDWTYATDAANSGTFVVGKGYSIKKDANTNSYISFTGVAKTNNLTATINQNTNNWNLVGNPFMAYILVSDLITDNSTNLDASHQAVYIWDNNKVGGAGYSALAGTDYIYPGQGFFVNAANSTAGNFTIDKTKLSHQTGQTLYKNAKPSIQLMVADGSELKYTEIEYLEGKTLGLDPSFDIGTFTATSTSFSIYTQLVSQNEGVDFMRQALPNTNFEKTIIPVGINAEAGKEITFTANAQNLPLNIKIFLEDRTENTFTHLDMANASYKVKLNNSLTGTGRFFLHTRSSALSTDDIVLQGVNMFATSKNTLKVTGVNNDEASLKLYNILGKKVLSTTFSSKGVSEISLPNLNTGIYIVQLTTEKGKINKKIILE